MKLFLKKTVLEAALERMRWLFDEFENVVVDFSGGKDSTVVLNLALQVAEEKGRLPLNVTFMDQEAEWQTVIDYVREVAADPRIKMQWFQMPVKIENATSVNEPFIVCWEPGKQWMREREPGAVTENVYGVDIWKGLFDAVTEHHYKGQKAVRIAGVRCSESPGRMKGLTSFETYEGATWGRKMNTKSGHYTMYPLYDWEDTDIWKAIHEHKWTYCNTAEAPIWMGDFSFKRIEDVRIGDTVIGFTEPGEERSTLTRATVIGTRSRMADVVKITLESGRTLRCTANHRWLRNNGINGNWAYGPAEVGDNLAHVIEPWEAQPVSAAGAWLGGMYDGEGNENCIAQSRSHNPIVCERLETAFAEIGVLLREDKGANASKFRIAGGRASLAKFVDRTRPVKAANFDPLILTTRFRVKDRVVSIEPDGQEAVFALQTTTENYIAWGYASSNCPIYDAMFQHGVAFKNMRVSNLHHETAVTVLYYLQEIEGETWTKLTNRLSGINTAGHMRADMFSPKTCPPMFKDWCEYRDYLIEHLIEDAAIQAKFRNRFAQIDALYEDPKVLQQLRRLQVSAVLVNDHIGTKMSSFAASHGQYAKNAGKNGALKFGKFKEPGGGANAAGS